MREEDRKALEVARSATRSPSESAGESHAPEDSTQVKEAAETLSFRQASLLDRYLGRRSCPVAAF